MLSIKGTTMRMLSHVYYTAGATTGISLFFLQVLKTLVASVGTRVFGGAAASKPTSHVRHREEDPLFAAGSFQEPEHKRLKAEPAAAAAAAAAPLLQQQAKQQVQQRKEAVAEKSSKAGGAGTGAGPTDLVSEAARQAEDQTVAFVAINSITAEGLSSHLVQPQESSAYVQMGSLQDLGHVSPTTSKPTVATEVLEGGDVLVVAVAAVQPSTPGRQHGGGADVPPAGVAAAPAAAAAAAAAATGAAVSPPGDDSTPATPAVTPVKKVQPTPVHADPAAAAAPAAHKEFTAAGSGSSARKDSDARSSHSSSTGGTGGSRKRSGPKRPGVR